LFEVTAERFFGKVQLVGNIRYGNIPLKIIEGKIIDLVDTGIVIERKVVCKTFAGNQVVFFLTGNTLRNTEITDKNLANYPSKKTHLRLKENAEEF
jgi:hypothetical protein